MVKQSHHVMNITCQVGCLFPCKLCRKLLCSRSIGVGGGKLPLAYLVRSVVVHSQICTIEYLLQE